MHSSFFGGVLFLTCFLKYLRTTSFCFFSHLIRFDFLGSLSLASVLLFSRTAVSLLSELYTSQFCSFVLLFSLCLFEFGSSISFSSSENIFSSFISTSFKLFPFISRPLPAFNRSKTLATFAV